MTIIRIPSPLRSYTQGQKEVSVSAATVAQALAGLIERHPTVEPHIFNEEGELRGYIQLFLNHEDVRHLKGIATPISGDDQLMILPSIAGG